MEIDWQINKSGSECNKYLLENEVNCDVSFKIGEDEVVMTAHKFILSSRSPVFERMFNGSFCESELDPVIPDVSPAAFRTLLRYCYYDCLDIDTDLALSVLYAAMKYMLPILETAARNILIGNPEGSAVSKNSTDGNDKLHACCKRYLMGNLCETNLLEVLRYAVTTGDEQLNAYCKRHLKENLSESNILDITTYVKDIADKKMYDTCKAYLKEHLSASNIWEIYKYSIDIEDKEMHQYCQKYFERDITIAMKALQSEEFPTTQYKVLLDILHINDEVYVPGSLRNSPGISIAEIELFTACNIWAQEECVRQQLDPTGDNKRTVLGECLSLIRFPTMLPKDLATTVYPTGILTQAEMVNLGVYIHRDPGSDCQVDFPSQRRQFVVDPAAIAPPYFSNRAPGAVFIQSEVRVMLSRLWTRVSGSYRITLSDDSSQSSWVRVLGTKHENHVSADGRYLLQYLDLQPPQVLEAGTKYAVTATRTKAGTLMNKLPGVDYTMVTGKCSPYRELKITPDMNTSADSLMLTFSLL